MSNISVEADKRRGKERCPACARLQLQIEDGRYVHGAVSEGEHHDAPHVGGSPLREHSSSGVIPGASDNISRAQHQRLPPPAEIICSHCMCSSEAHEGTGPNGQRCCGTRRDGPSEEMCECCRTSDGCRAWREARACPAGGTEAECGTPGAGIYCTHCTCTCASNNPHKFDDKSTWVTHNADVQRACGVCLACWAGWCIPISGTKRKLIGATREPEEPFARQWRPGRDADVYVLTGLFDGLTGLLPEGSFAHAVFGSSLRYFEGFVGRVEAKHALREAGIMPGDRSAAIGEAWSGGGSQHPPEKPAGARKVVAAPLRQGPGADRHFSRQHGRRDHNWQWDMLQSPWSLGLMQRGRLALGVSETEADEFEEAGIIAFPGHVVRHKDSVKNGGYGKTIGTLVLRSPDPAFVCLQVQGGILAKAVEMAEELGIELPPRFEQKGRFKFAINELDAWAMIGGTARNDAEHAVVCGRRLIPAGEPGEGFVRVAFNMRWGWQDDRRV